MIPKRVKLSGFLCYKDEQVVDFGGSTLWMLAGMNGSGKSTIFDAVTYALFGHHRGGAQAATELINKDSQSLSVEFEFTVDDQLYQIRRTLRRDARGGARGTQNIFRHQTPTDPTKSPWVGVPDTNLSDGFKAWVRDKIGLNYDTFTSSVLLLQGRAEKLLDSKPSGRAEVLAGIVDLDRYIHLHEKADSRRKACRAKLETIESQLTGIPDVTEVELLAAENRLLDTETAHTTASQDIERLQELEYQAKQWQDVQARLIEIRGKWERAKTLIADAKSIEDAYKRLQTLNQVIPQVLLIQAKQAALHESENRTAQYATLRTKSLEDQNNHLSAIDTERLKRSKLELNLAADEKHLAQVSVKVQELAGQLKQITLYESQLEECKRLQAELDRLPPNLADAVQQAEVNLERTQELGRVIPFLERLVEQRAKVTQARESITLAESKVQRKQDAGLEAKKHDEVAAKQLEHAEAALRKADDAKSSARTLEDKAKEAANEFVKMEGAQLCRACGQKLTLGHFETEKVKRDKELKAAAKHHKEMHDAQARAALAVAAARDQKTASTNDLDRLRDEYKEAKRELDTAKEKLNTAIGECRHAYLNLPENFRYRVAPTMLDDWTITSWPSMAELAALRHEADDRDTARATLDALRKQLSRYEKLQGQIQTAHANLGRTKDTLPPEDPAKLRELEINWKADEGATRIKVESAKRQIKDTERAIEQHNAELDTIRATLTAITSQLSAEEATRKEQLDAIDRAAKLLPEDWREKAIAAGLAEQNRWKTELDELKRKKTEERYQELAVERAGVEAVRQEMAQLEVKASEYPLEAQCPADTIKMRLNAAKVVATNADEALQKAREEKAILDGYRKQRQELRKQSLELDKDFNFSTLLAQLLGRDRLQRHLVRTAERHIVDYANGILDRLSGGQLYLRLCGSDDGSPTERALELEAFNRQTGGNAINVAFLSGSQRFRVAVSLALGIGQYASKQHRPIESVIIDEGFGCLDRSGRQVMIQELQNLRGHLQCILLVSHQEEFADAFPDGYRFELTDGATKISRFQR